MESQPQNKNSGLILKTFTHALEIFFFESVNGQHRTIGTSHEPLLW